MQASKAAGENRFRDIDAASAKVVCLGRKINGRSASAIDDGSRPANNAGYSPTVACIAAVSETNTGRPASMP